jgi:hypothetical protein
MAHKELVVALGMVVAILPGSAAAQFADPPLTISTAAASDPAKYCMHITVTGNISDTVQCWTRLEWADQGVDVDKEWPKNGVTVIKS